MQGTCASQCTSEFWLLIIQIKDLLKHTGSSHPSARGFFPRKPGWEVGCWTFRSSSDTSFEFNQGANLRGGSHSLAVACDSSKTREEFTDWQWKRAGNSNTTHLTYKRGQVQEYFLLIERGGKKASLNIKGVCNSLALRWPAGQL